MTLVLKLLISIGRNARMQATSMSYTSRVHPNSGRSWVALIWQTCLQNKGRSEIQRLLSNMACWILLPPTPVIMLRNTRRHCTDTTFPTISWMPLQLACGVPCAVTSAVQTKQVLQYAPRCLTVFGVEATYITNCFSACLLTRDYWIHNNTLSIVVDSSLRN
jgi:hypothetical protein